MAVKKKLIVMPNGRPYVIKQKVAGTKYLQNRDTGLMEGRKRVKGQGDGTGVKRVDKDFVLVKKSDRARGHTRQVPYTDGMIVGRY